MLRVHYFACHLSFCAAPSYTPMAFASYFVLSPTRVIPRRTSWRCALSPAEKERKAKLEAEAALARRKAETRAVNAVVQGTAEMYRDSKYGKCPACDGPIVIPGLSHSLCKDCGWVERPQVPEEEVKLEGHHD